MLLYRRFNAHIYKFLKTQTKGSTNNYRCPCSQRSQRNLLCFGLLAMTWPSALIAIPQMARL